MKKLTSKVLTILVMLGVFIFSTIAWAADGQCNKTGEVKQKLHAYFEQLAADRIFSGAVLVAQDGHVLLKDGFGLADYDTGEKNKPKTRQICL